jgi:hypothetical protein
MGTPNFEAAYNRIFGRHSLERHFDFKPLYVSLRVRKDVTTRKA